MESDLKNEPNFGAAVIYLKILKIAVWDIAVLLSNIGNWNGEYCFFVMISPMQFGITTTICILFCKWMNEERC